MILKKIKKQYFRKNHEELLKDYLKEKSEKYLNFYQKTNNEIYLELAEENLFTAHYRGADINKSLNRLLDIYAILDQEKISKIIAA